MEQGWVMEKAAFKVEAAIDNAVPDANQEVDENLTSAGVLAGGQGAVGRRALLQVFSRLEKILDDEVALLQQGKTDGLEEITQSKNQCLLDLTRLSRALNMETLMMDDEGGAFKQEVIRIHEKIVANEATLKFYLDAAREVAAMVAESVRMAESDGTYAESGPFGRYGL